MMHIISPLLWYESGLYQQKKYKAFEIFLGMFTLVCLMYIYIWRHFLPNSACAKVDSAMVQWCDNDGAMTQWQWRKKSSLHCHHTIVPSWSHHYHHSVIPSRHCITRHRVNVIATSRHHHRVIAPSAQPAMVRWLVMNYEAYLDSLYLTGVFSK